MAKNSVENQSFRDWLTKHGLEPPTFLPEIWQRLRENLAILKNLSGLTHEEIARRIYGVSADKKVSGSQRVMVTRALNELHDIEKLEQIARACRFDPLLLAVPNLQEHINELLKTLAQGLQFETSIFSALRKCGKCHHINRDPNARYCSQCGTRIIAEGTKS